MTLSVFKVPVLLVVEPLQAPSYFPCSADLHNNCRSPGIHYQRELCLDARFEEPFVPLRLSDVEHLEAGHAAEERPAPPDTTT